jgi:outer membrane lipoprotein-sorting protein
MYTSSIKRMILMNTLIFIIYLMVTGHAAALSDEGVDQIISDSIQAFENLSDYTCRLDKKVNKSGRTHHDPDISVKYKKSGHYYFRWEEGRFSGREAIYVAGKNKDRILAHPGGFFRFLTFRLDLEGREAMKRNHHSLRDSGIEKIIRIIQKDYNRSKELRMGTIELLGENFIYGRDVWIIQCEFPEKREFYSHKIILCFDKELKLPIKVSVFDWSDTLFEEYCFRNLKVNTGIEARDFDPKNPEYRFF